MAEPGEIEPVAEGGEGTAKAQFMGLSGWRLRVVKLIVAFVLGLAALVALIVFGLDTGPGHRFIANQIQKLSFENGMRIRIGRIEGSIYKQMVLHDLSIGDPKGTFLYSPKVAVDWRPFAYLNSHVDVRSASADRMTLRRLPEFRPTTSEGPLLPDLDIDIGRLHIGRFIAEAPVAGERRIASIDGKAHIADGRAQVQLDAVALAAPGGAGGDRLALTLDAVPESNRLAIKGRLDAPKGGIIAAMGGFPEAVAMRVDGRGDWRKWDGKLDADLGGKELARLALSARDGTFALKGPTYFARLFEGPTANLLGPVTNVDLSAVLKERRADLSGSIASDAFNLGADGLVDLSDNSFDDLKLAFVLLKPSALAENLSGSGVRALLTLNGAFATPRVQYAVNAARVVMNDMGLERFTASGTARVDADHILIPVDARAARITGLDTVAGGTLRNVRLAGDVAIDGPRVLSDNMRIRSDRIDAKLVLLADMSKGLYTGAIDGRIDNYRIESVGIFDIETDIDLKTEKQGFALAGRVRARSTRLLNESLHSFLGGNAVASSDVRYGSDGVVRFANLRLNAPLLRVAGGRGSYSPDGRIAFVADATSSQYGKIGVRVAGTITDPNAHVSAERPGLGIGLANLEADVTGAPNGYRLAATGDTDYGPLSADVTLGLRQGPVTLQINKANLAGIAFAGSLTQTRAGPFAGQLTANGNGLGGVVRLGAEGRFQEAAFNLRANDTVLPGPANLAIGSAIIDGRVVLYDQPYVVADAQIADTRYGTFDINAARVIIDYRDGRGQAKALIEGAGGAPFRLAANADLQPKLWRVMLRGRMRGVTVRTASPARIIPGDDGYELLPTRLDVGQGSMRLAGTYGNGIKLQSRLDSLDLAIVNSLYSGYGIGGTATGSLDFQQASADAFPRADARLTIDDFTRTTSVTVSKPVDVNFVGKLLPEGGEARAVIRQRGSIIGRLAASLKPLGPDEGGWTTRLTTATLGGGIRYNGPADTLFSFAGQADQGLSGPIGVAADFSCRLSDPCINGILRANNLTYENHTYGTRLTNMAVSGRFTGDRFEIEKLTATAGNGAISAQGYASLAAASGYPMDISATLDNARLASGEALAARATGRLRLTKTAGETALLSGELRLPETRYKIIRQGAAEVPELTGVRFKPRRRQVITGDEEAKPGPGLASLIRLDLRLRAPEKLYVSGMGLESEWNADLHMTGTSAAPKLTGEVELVRGTLGFAGRSFTLDEGRIGFTGPAFDPTLDIAASDEVDDVIVNVNVGGRAMSPQITFASSPALPQDEILSRILFGSSVSNISTLQAVQLAASLNALRGSGGGLNPLGTLRSATGVDRLRILGPDEDTGRGTALAAGQYLTDDIYIELITDTRGFTATQLEVSVLPWLSVLSQAGGSGVTNFNVRVKKDY
jgi:translocation and assembly module TamB